MSSQVHSSLLPLLAGASAGMTEALITYPTEYVKTVSQLSTGTGGPRPPLQVAKDIFGTRGLGGFYTGCGAMIAGNALKSATRFYTYETIKGMLPQNESGKLSPLNNLAAGIGSGCLEAIVAVTPSEAIKTRMIEAQSSSCQAAKPSTVGVITNILKTEGPGGLYRGLVPTVMKHSANSAVRFSTYESLKHAVTQYTGAPLDTPTIMVIGGLTGLVTVVVKTRMQQAGNRYSSSLDCFVGSLKGEGLTVFWRGSSPRVVRLLIAGTVSFSIYESVLKFLQRM